MEAIELAEDGRMNADEMTAEEFVSKWLAHWQVPWPEERAKQLVGDLRTLTGDRIKFESEE